MKNLTLKNTGTDSFRMVESMNSLKTNITFCGENIQVIAITSSMPGEGKSSIAFELSKSLARSGKKVLLIDADIRKSKFLRTRGACGVDRGLTHYLSGQAELKEVFYKVNIKNMAFIPTGPSVLNPSELIENEKFKKMIAVSRKAYDYIIVDVTPVGVVIDAAIVAKQCDGVVMVIEQGKISRRVVNHAIGQLKRAKIRILGMVINKVDVKSSYSYR